MNSQLPAAAPAPRRNWVRRLVNLLVAARGHRRGRGDLRLLLRRGARDRPARRHVRSARAVLPGAVRRRARDRLRRRGRAPRRPLVGARVGLGGARRRTRRDRRDRRAARDELHACGSGRPRASSRRRRWWRCCSRSACFSRCSVSQGRSALAPTPWPATSMATGACRGPTMPAPLDLPALPAAPAPRRRRHRDGHAADGRRAPWRQRPPWSSAEHGHDRAVPATRAPIALPAGPETGPLTPPDGLPAMTRPAATEPAETLPPAAPPVASQRAPEGEPAPPTLPSPAVSPARVPSEPEEPEAASAGPAAGRHQVRGQRRPGWPGRRRGGGRGRGA